MTCMQDPMEGLNVYPPLFFSFCFLLCSPPSPPHSSPPHSSPYIFNLKTKDGKLVFNLQTKSSLWTMELRLKDHVHQSLKATAPYIY